MKHEYLRLLTAAVFLFSVTFANPGAAQTSTASVGSVAQSAGKQIGKRVLLPVALFMAAYDTAEAYEQHCQLVPEKEAYSCAAEAFTRGQIEEFRNLGHDVSELWTYVLVPNAVHFWDENGDGIKDGARHAADTATDTVIAIGDAAVENGPIIWENLRSLWE